MSSEVRNVDAINTSWDVARQQIVDVQALTGMVTELSFDTSPSFEMGANFGIRFQLALDDTETQTFADVVADETRPKTDEANNKYELGFNMGRLAAKAYRLGSENPSVDRGEA